MMTFGEMVKVARKTRDLTLQDVARACGTVKGYVSGIEGGKVSPPSWRVVRRMCRILGLPETKMQLLAWAEKAPAVVREEALRRVFGKEAKRGTAV